MTHGQLAPHAAQLIEWNIAGVPVADQVRRLAADGVIVSRQALRKFRLRHADGIEAPKARIVAAVVAKAVAGSIREKDERLRRLDVLVDAMEEIRTTRGLMATDVKWIGDSEVGREVEVERFDAALVKEYRAAMHDAAVELGELIEKKELSGGLVLAVGLIDEIRRRSLDQ